MTASFAQVLVCLITGITLIVVLTSYFKVHAFFALFIACFAVGLGVQLPVADIITAMKDGFGNIMKSLGFIIVLGTTLGVLLEYTGSTQVMASVILKTVGERNTALAMSLTGFIVGLPIFCDSGYVVLSGLNASLSKRTGISPVVMAASLATGLYSVHCLIPPHPGAAAAAGTIGVDLGQLILVGIVVAIPAMVVGHIWARYAGKGDKGKEVYTEERIIPAQAPSAIGAFLPVLVPILLIALRSLVTIDPAINHHWLKILLALGDPVMALSIGVLLALAGRRAWKRHTLSHLLQEAAEKAGGILVIIGAGGAFGAVLAATKIGTHLSTALPLAGLGLFFPFLITFVLKTAQGSSTVAIITAASIVQPLLPVLGLATPKGQLLSVLAMGAGSMMISHANDAYFWVIAKFSGLEMRSMLKVYTIATVLMGLTTWIAVYLLSLIL